MDIEPTDNKWSALTDYIEAHQCDWSMQPDPSGEQWGIHLADDPPHNRLLGPVFERGKTCGLIVSKGETVCRWGETSRADMTFSVTKTCLALVAGIAYDQGLIPNIDQPIAQCLPGIGFDDEHNCQISWRQMLQFTSEWQGKCFGIPDQIDHNRHIHLQPEASFGRKGELRQLQTPGTHWEYNDVRINQFSLALLHLFKRSMPDVLNEYIMEPLGASNTWSWHGYENSWATIDGQKLQSVPGGGQWGGGMVINAEDQALLAHLMINLGKLNDKPGSVQLVSHDWIKMMLQPCPIAPFYGFFTWLNHNNNISKKSPASSFFAMGIGGQLLLHDPENQLVGIYRWLDSEHMNAILDLTYEILESK
ncbi:MAG: CubicO group peptidase (beta-lactamase class C family) [bacterium]|jgi:CubicO group peptidase (beta-lactamase class C family)